MKLNVKLFGNHETIYNLNVDNTNDLGYLLIEGRIYGLIMLGDKHYFN